MKMICGLLILLLTIPLAAQDFFSTLDEQTTDDRPYELNGFIRGAYFAGRGIDEDNIEQKSGYGEMGLKMRVRKADWGDGYAEIRFRKGHEFQESISEVDVREAYVNTYFGNFDVRMGHQIVVWGRADGFNPTNNITPQNMLVRSSVEDDRKIGNFLFRANYNLHPLRFEAIWVPQYRSSVLPIQLFPFPDYVELAPEELPDADIANSSFALRLNFQFNIIDGSLSYFQGFMPLPGVAFKSLEVQDTGFRALVANKPYRMNVFGGDFSTTIGSFGLRGEVAFRQPINDYKNPVNVFIPNPDIQGVFGIDRTYGDFSVILQYIGRYVIDFQPFQDTGFPTDQLILNNRMISSQLYEINHAVFIRPALTLFHETMDIEALVYYNVDTEEALFRPLLSKDITDALTFKLGADWYVGPENTLFGNIDRALSSAFVEFVAFF